MTPPRVLPHTQYILFKYMCINVYIYISIHMHRVHSTTMLCVPLKCSPCTNHGKSKSLFPTEKNLELYILAFENHMNSNVILGQPSHQCMVCLLYSDMTPDQYKIYQHSKPKFICNKC